VPEEAVEQDAEHDEGDDDVEEVALGEEGVDAQGDTGDGRGDEHQEAELNDGEAVKVSGSGEDAGERVELGRDAAEGVVGGVVVTVAREVEDSAEKDDEGGGECADAQELADVFVELGVVVRGDEGLVGH